MLNGSHHKVVEAATTLLQRIPRLHKPQNVNEKHAQSLGANDRIALAVTNAMGTMWALYFMALFMLVWCMWQFLMREKAFDPYPFAFLLFLGNIVQLLLMPLIMVGQSILSKHAEMRADEQYKTTLTSYQDLEHIMEHLDAQDKELIRQTQMLMQLIQAQSEAPDASHSRAIAPGDGLQ
ncbi:MAG: DUF1003 domain-containing protein [Candidatus Obscuribacterales bacterium]